MLPRHGVPTALPGNVRIPSHAPRLVVGVGVRRPVAEGLKAIALPFPARHRLLVRRPMHPPVGYGPRPHETWPDAIGPRNPAFKFRTRPAPTVACARGTLAG